MRYVGENCPYCGVAFTEQDDVVVCPECATPHHRVCWLAHGECANTEKHGTDFVWKKSSAPTPEKETERQDNSRENANLDIVCPDCGATCANGTLRCPDCGAVLIPFANPMGEPPLAQFKPGFNSGEIIRGLKAGDIALFCRTAGASYIKKFRKKFSWNWAALLFSPFWFFYRKMYEAGAIFLAVYLALNLLLIPAELHFNKVFYDSSASVTVNGMMAEIDELIQPYILEDGSTGGFLDAFMEGMYGESVALSEEGYAAVSEYIKNNEQLIADQIIKPMTQPVLIIYGIHLLSILLRVIAALVADRLYYKKACVEIRRARGATSDERMVQLELFRKGGTNIFLGSGVYFVCSMLLNAAIMLATR